MATQPRSKVSGSARATIDPDEIRNWVEGHGGQPAQVKRTRRGGEPGILRIDFPGYSGAGSLERISWDEFFEKFEESKLAFLYQDETGSGRPSRFNKLVKRSTVDVSSGGRARGRRAAPSRRKAAPARARRKTSTRRKATSRVSAGGAVRRKASPAARAGRKTQRKTATTRRKTSRNGSGRTRSRSRGRSRSSPR